MVNDAPTQAAVESELDRVVSELFEASVKAMQDGDPHGSRLFASRAYAAIASRTPEHKARLTAEVEQRISDGIDFFAAAGERDRAMLEARPA